MQKMDVVLLNNHLTDFYKTLSQRKSAWFKTIPRRTVTIVIYVAKKPVKT